MESSTDEPPAIVRTAIDQVGKTAASGSYDRRGAAIRQIEKAAQPATAAANDYCQAARWATWQAAGVALLVNVALVVGLWRFGAVDPTAAGIQARHAERDELAAVVADLESRGGKARLMTCGEPARLCIRTDESGKDAGFGYPAKGETWRVIKGY
ncbi:MAG: hypothetical protein H0X36_13515 [Sphingomonadaceae bacterium]|nr:hypothetical protein [Sphingomonadaceae bacterium]